MRPRGAMARGVAGAGLLVGPDALLQLPSASVALRDRLLGVSGGPDLVVRYGNGHRTSYVMTAFEAEEAGGRLSPDPPVAPWLRPVLDAVFRRGSAGAFRAPSWTPRGGGA